MAPTGIMFTQHLLPNGRTEPQWIDYPADPHRWVITADTWTKTKRRAADLVAAGYSLHMELLSDWRTASFTVEAPNDGGDIAIVNVMNGPGVPGAIVKLIDSAHRTVFASGAQSATKGE